MHPLLVRRSPRAAPPAWRALTRKRRAVIPAGPPWRAAREARCGSSGVSRTGKSDCASIARRRPSGVGTSTIGSRPNVSCERERSRDVVDLSGGYAHSRTASIAHSAADALAGNSPALARSSRGWPREQSWWRSRSSTASSGQPSTSASARNWRSLPTASTRSPSAALQQFVWSDARVRAAHPAGNLPRQRVGRALVDQCCQQAREQVDLNALAFAGLFAMAQRGQDPHRREQAADHVHERDADLLRLPLSGARDAHQPPERLHEQVVSGSAAASAVAAPKPVIEQYTRPGFSPRRSP